MEAIEEQLTRELSVCRHLPGVVDVRVKGALGVVQLAPEAMDIAGLKRKFIERGVWLRPFGDIVYVMPAFTITAEELSKLTRSIAEVVGGMTV